jgi:hypothetical protein
MTSVAKSQQFSQLIIQVMVKAAFSYPGSIEGGA